VKETLLQDRHSKGDEKRSRRDGSVWLGVSITVRDKRKAWEERGNFRGQNKESGNRQKEKTKKSAKTHRFFLRLTKEKQDTDAQVHDAKKRGAPVPSPRTVLYG